MGFPCTQRSVTAAVFEELRSERPGRLAALEDILAIADEVGHDDAKSALLQAWNVLLRREADAEAESQKLTAPVLRIVR